MEWTRLAQRQGAQITRAQLARHGVASTTIDRWCRVGCLHRTAAAGVYRVAGAPITAESRVWFAVLCSGSPLSYLTAAQWWDLPVDTDGLVHITRMGRRRLDWPAGVRVHRVALTLEHTTSRYAAPITTRTETLLDCMGWLPLGRAGDLADRAVQQGWLRSDDFAARLELEPGRWGNRQLRRLLPRLGDGAAAESERRLHRLLRSRGLQGWTPNLVVLLGGDRFEIDVAFPQQRIAIEVDGLRYHSAADRFQADRRKQNALIKAGWRVLRFTWADLVERPEYVLAQVCSLLAA